MSLCVYQDIDSYLSKRWIGTYDNHFYLQQIKSYPDNTDNRYTSLNFLRDKNLIGKIRIIVITDIETENRHNTSHCTTTIFLL